MNRGAGTLRTLLIVLGSSWFGFALNILRVLVLPAKLGDMGLGQVTLAVSFTTFFGIFTALGTSVYLVRAIAQDPTRATHYLGNALLLRVVMGVLVLGLMVAVGHLFGYSPNTQSIILIVACDIRRPLEWVIQQFHISISLGEPLYPSSTPFLGKRV